MSTPKQKPGKSKQDYGTPAEFLRAVERDFHVAEWILDLAATLMNSVSRRAYFGPGSPWGEDALAQDWLSIAGDCWLNPEFADINPWAAKCHASRSRNGRIFQLTPASTGTNWYVDHVDGIAHVVALQPRIQFDGCPDPYPKDLVLSVYGPVRGGFSTWRWKP
jgi:hypothetical protein